MPSRTSVVKHPGAILLSEPRPTAERLAFLAPGTVVFAADAESAYSRIVCDLGEGFVVSSAVQPLAIAAARVASSSIGPTMLPAADAAFHDGAGAIDDQSAGPATDPRPPQPATAWPKTVIIGASALAILSTFLPWVKFTAVFVGSGSLNLWNADATLDAIIVVCVAIAAALHAARWWDQWNLPRQPWAPAIGGLIVSGLATYHVIHGSSAVADINAEGFAYASVGEGNYLGLAAGLALLVAGYFWAQVERSASVGALGTQTPGHATADSDRIDSAA